MVVTDEMDAGPIVATEPLEIRPDDTAVTLEERAAGAAADLLRRALPEWLAGRLTPRAQPSEGVTVTRPLRRDDGRLDPTLPAAQLERQVRAYQPWPGSFVETPSGRLIVCSARAVPGAAAEEPGRLVRDRDGLVFTTHSGRLLLDQIQLAGKRRMSGPEFLRGYPALAETVTR
jgi:methionyl-tRNA formyltransferase